MGKRSTDETGPTAGERVSKWLSNIKIVITLWLSLFGAVAYGTNDSVRSWIHGEPLPEVPGEISPLSSDIHPEVRAKIESILNKLGEQDSRFSKIESRSRTGDSHLSNRVTKIEALVN